MTVSAVRSFNPAFAEFLAEAFARIQILGRDIQENHIDEAVRSANFTFVKMANEASAQFQMVAGSVSLVSGTPTYTLPAGLVDIFKMVYRRQGLDTPVWPIGRGDYLNIPDKTNAGRPYNYFLDKGKVGNTQRTITMWPTPDSSVDTLKYWGIYRPTDTTGLPDDIGIAWEFFDAYASDLAMRLAEKYKPDQYGMKAGIAAEALKLAKSGARERAPSRLRMRGYGRRR